MKAHPPNTERAYRAPWLGVAELIFVYPFLFLLLLIGLLHAGATFSDWLISAWDAYWKHETIRYSEIPATSLISPLLASIGLYLVHERRSLVERLGVSLHSRLTSLEDEARGIHSELADQTLTIIDSLDGVEFRSFKDDLSLKSYLNERVRSAVQRIDDLIWAENRPETPRRSPVDQQKWDRLEAEYEEIIAEVSTAKIYREIFILSRRSRLQKFKQRHEDKKPGYFCRVLPESRIPRLQFVIVDGFEVIFASGNHPVPCAIKHPKLVALLADYFDRAWIAGTPIVHSESGRAVWDEKAFHSAIVEAETFMEQANERQTRRAATRRTSQRAS